MFGVSILPVTLYREQLGEGLPWQNLLQEINSLFASRPMTENMSLNSLITW